MSEPMLPETAERAAEQELMHDLAPDIERLHAAHLKNAKEWFPHEMVPYSEGQDYPPGEPWSPGDSPLSAALASALAVNLLTEDNLPHYFRTIVNIGEPDRPLAQWANRWTAEEGRHSIVIRDYIIARRLLDPRELERGRMRQVEGGVVPQPANFADALAYTSLQELATKVAHTRTGQLLRDERGDEVGFAIMKRVGADEGLHYNFYSGLLKALGERDPDRMMVALSRNIPFDMPGTDIKDYGEHSARIAEARIFGPREVKEEVIDRLLKLLRIENVTGLSPAGEAARSRIRRKTAQLGKVIVRFEEKLADSPS